MGCDRIFRGGTARAALGVCAAMLLSLAFAPSAWAGAEHLFDPVLSLSESTVPSAEDEVPDPGTPPLPRFEQVCGSATDPHGDIYASSTVLKSGSVVGGRIDIFNPQGEFLVRIESPRTTCGLAVDSDGNIYSGGIESGQVDLFHPSEYPPTSSTTYSLTKSFPIPASCGLSAVAVDPSNDHFYLGRKCTTEEYGSAAEGSPLVKELPLPVGEINGGTPFLSGMDVYGKSHDIYAAVLMQPTIGAETVPSRLYVFDGSDGHKKCEILGAETPGDLQFQLGASVAVDQANGDLYVYSIYQNTVYQFANHGENECEFIGTLPKPPTLKGNNPFGDIAVDDPLVEGEAGYDSPNAGYVFVTSGTTPATSHLFAYRPRTVTPPTIKGQKATGATETEAVLRAELNPGGREATYHFEYVTEADFEASGYANATSVPVPDANLAKGGAFAPVSEPATGLQAGVAYRFRLVASNCEAGEPEPEDCVTLGEGKPGEEGEDARFSTYPTPPVSPSCPNASLRTGLSASLPDCRAYELVTPPDTGGHIPKISILGLGFSEMSFDTTPVSPDGASVVFGSNSGSLPGMDGSGFFDTYEALRDEGAGWQSHFTGLTGAQAERPRPGGMSPDHLYAFWNVEEGKGALVNPVTHYAQYLRVPAGTVPSVNCAPTGEPEGRFELIGCGSIAGEPRATGRWISPGGGHVIFDTSGRSDPVPLESCAPPAGTDAIYDRVPEGLTQCISVPPAGASPATEAQFETADAEYQGTSADGSTVAFKVAGTLYARLDNAETVEVAEGDPAFGGISGNGDRVVYLSEPTGFAVPQGEIHACEVAAGPCAGAGSNQEPIQIGSGGESILVNVSADGSHVYFVSPVVLTGSAENEWGAKAEAGAKNLYSWDGEAVQFVASLDSADLLEGDTGLGLWVKAAVSPKQDAFTGSASDPSRSTPNGAVLIFESQAGITDDAGGGPREVFRYEAEAPAGRQLSCVSCSPIGEKASSDARLEIPEEGQLIATNPSPVNAISQIANVSSDGGKVFFQSAERLVPADRDGKLDVYEWEAQGGGGCAREAGCLSLISFGRSSEDDYLYAMTPDGRDVFILSADTLVGQDLDSTPSIYDARVDGGFPPPPSPPAECLGEACQPAMAAPDEPPLASPSFEGPGNVRKEGRSKPHCAKGKRRVTSKGKTRCVNRHSHKRGAER